MRVMDAFGVFREEVVDVMLGGCCGAFRPYPPPKGFDDFGLFGGVGGDVVSFGRSEREQGFFGGGEEIFNGVRWLRWGPVLPVDCGSLGAVIFSPVVACEGWARIPFFKSFCNLFSEVFDPGGAFGGLAGDFRVSRSDCGDVGGEAPGGHSAKEADSRGEAIELLCLRGFRFGLSRFKNFVGFPGGAFERDFGTKRVPRARVGVLPNISKYFPEGWGVGYREG